MGEGTIGCIRQVGTLLRSDVSNEIGLLVNATMNAIPLMSSCVYTHTFVCPCPCCVWPSPVLNHLTHAILHATSHHPAHTDLTMCSGNPIDLFMATMFQLWSPVLQPSPIATNPPVIHVPLASQWCFAPISLTLPEHLIHPSISSHVCHRHITHTSVSTPHLFAGLLILLRCPPH